MPESTLQPRRFLETSRRDAWWVPQLLVLFGFGTFLIYANWAAFQNEHYTHGPYLSPFYSPELWGSSPHAWFGPKPGWWPAWLPFSPALLILWIPGLFRFTCYYYRGAYYKAFWADPPGCAVGEPRKKYLGEQSLPLILQNFHRYFMFFTMAVLLVLYWDVWEAFWFDDGHGGHVFGLGLGTVIMAVNVVLLTLYLGGCHSLRHLVGGNKDNLASTPMRMKSWRCVTCLNQRHMNWAWASLLSVGFSDLYIRLCSMGVWSDWRIF